MNDMDKTSKILFCGCVHYELTPESVKREILGTLRAEGVDVVAVPDLCRLAGRNDPMLREMVETGPLTIAACYPRAVKWLLYRAGIDTDANEIRIVNMRTGSSADILEELLGRTPSTVRETDMPEPDADDQWIPWFPVIDYGRCKSCMQCYEFCLFGAYEKSEDGRVEVVNPDRCKTNCPACARICPAAAIIFPKLDEQPINGAEIEDETAVRANIKVNVEKILGNDIYATLEQRKQKRRRMLVDREKMAKAVAERKAHTGDDA